MLGRATFVTMIRTITCREAAAWLDEYSGGNLPSARRQALATHLRGCGDCLQVLKDLRCTRRLLRRLPRERMPTDMKTYLLHELRRSRPSPDPAPHPYQPGSSQPPRTALRTPRPRSDTDYA